MDQWVIAAAAGAGYLAKFWLSSLRDKNSLSESTSRDPNCEKPDSPSCPLRRLALKKKLGKDIFADKAKGLEGRFSDMSNLDGDSTSEVASTSGSNGEKLGNSSNYENCNVLSVTDLPLGFSTNENCRESRKGSTENGDIYVNSGDLLSHFSVGEFVSVHDIMRNRSSLKFKCSYRHYAQPLNSLESCLTAQLYKENVAMEECLLSSLPSPFTLTTRPLLVTDGSRIISRSSGDSFRVWINTEENKLHNKPSSENKGTVFGVPPLQKIKSLEMPKKMKVRTGTGGSGRLSCSSKMVSGNRYSRGGAAFILLMNFF